MKNNRYQKLNKPFIGMVFFFFLITFFLVQSCTKKTGEIPKVTVIQQCDTISYAQDIAPIIQKNCSLSGCHVAPTPAGGVLLDSYDKFKLQAENGRIKARVIEEKPSRMPPAGITSEEKQLIECWLNNGYLP